MSWDTQKRRMEYPPDWTRRRRRVLMRDDYVCQIRGPRCTYTATDVDHIERGNNHDESNLQAACRPCHAGKSAREGNATQARMRALRRRPRDRHPGEP